jgi:DNA-binding NarL/FixJ family response regulator
MQPITIAIIDDQQLFRQGIASLINNVPEFKLLLEADNGEAFLDVLAKQEQDIPQIALIDMEMPVMDGIALNEKLQKNYPGIKVIILSVHAKERLIAHMVHAGASGYLLKNCDKEELLNALKTVHNSGFYINMHTLRAMQSNTSKKQKITNIDGISIDISLREREILTLICREYNNAEIAEKLFLSPRTVEGHRNHLLAKTGCKNTAGLVIFAVKSHIYNVIN